MAPSVTSSPIKEAASPSPPLPDQSVLDWASPDEERDNPGKLDTLGNPLASFNDLRTRESNKEPGNWTVAHAVHVARWEFHQAGYTSTQPRNSLDSIDKNGLQAVINSLKKNPNLEKDTVTCKVGEDVEDEAEKGATQPCDAAPSKEMSFDTSSLQLLIINTIDDRLQEFKKPMSGKKRKFSNGRLDELIEAAVEKKLASYEVLLDDYAGLTDHLLQCSKSFSDLPEKASKLKQLREELKAAANLDLQSSETQS